MIVAVHQPQYLPWPGFFEKLSQADEFIFLDVVQYEPREWQNRNRIRTHQGVNWLTVPVHAHGRPKIKDVTIDSDRPWRDRHIKTLEASYKRSPYYKDVMKWLEPLLLREWEKLADLNIAVARAIADALGVVAPTSLASELGELPEAPDARIISICKKFNADVYLSGAGGKNYMDLGEYDKCGIEVRFMDYSPPVYPQVHGETISGLSAIDLLFQAGPQAFHGARRAA